MSLVADRVSVRRGTRLIVDEASLGIDAGSVTALVGPNGAGKSTVLRILAGELRPSAGSASLDGQSLSSIPVAELAKRRGVMAQNSAIMFDFTVAEIIDLGWIRHDGEFEDHYRTALYQVVDECRIGHLMERTFNTLSGGEQQRVQFARCLMQIWQPPDHAMPRYLLLDEPTSDLDLAHGLLVLNLARELARRRVGVLLVLHDLNLAARFCDRIVLMFDGHVAASGEPAIVLDEELLSDVYATSISVEWHESLERIVVHA